jgi:hypothetical protein
MGSLKQEFHEVISGECGAIEALEVEYHMAYEAHRTLHARLPVYRTPEQEQQLRAAYNALSWAKWKLDTARFWEENETKHQHNRGEMT